MVVSFKTALSYVVTIAFTCVVSSFSVYFLFEGLVERGNQRTMERLTTSIQGNADSVRVLGMNVEQNRASISTLSGDIRALFEAQSNYMAMMHESSRRFEGFESYMRDRIANLAIVASRNDNFVQNHQDEVNELIRMINAEISQRNSLREDVSELREMIERLQQLGRTQ